MKTPILIPPARQKANGASFIQEYYSLEDVIVRLERVYGDLKGDR